MHAETRVEFPAKEGCLCSYETLLLFFFTPLFNFGSKMGEDFNYRPVNEEGMVDG